MEDFLTWIVRWLVIPAIMTVGLVLSWRITKAQRGPAANPGSAAGAWAGMLAGIVIGSTFAMTQLHGDSGSDSAEFRFHLLAVVAGAVVGFGLPMLILLFRQHVRFIGVLTLVLSGGSSLALAGYLFKGDARDFVALLAMCLLVGGLLYFVFFSHNWQQLVRYLFP